MNQLAKETSPYLLQHKDNPVDWHIWSAETLAKARAEDKPILLSVGYAACHWCHVMAAESFEDDETAALMNSLFVPVKVDREERPDLDAIYQNALAAMGQHGGWPLTMFVTPDGEPFWGGTYYPPTNKYGRPAFRDVLMRVAEVYRKEKATVAKNTGAIRQALHNLSETPPESLFTPDNLNEIASKLCDLIDPVEGGLGQPPKFPQSPVFAYLWRAYRRTGNAKFRDGVLLTLDRMSQGGIYDHLGGGYARYSTDNDWLVPHFEKMLYDNAQLIELLTWAWQDTKNPLYAQRVEETIAWMLREMRVEDAAFAAALDADSEHEEGKFYVWTAAEVTQILGPDAPLFMSHYDVHRIGNWEGKSILNRSEKPDLMDADTEAVLAVAREKLWKLREARVHPGRDHKVLADWNGLAISALCLAAGAFARKDWLTAAREAFDFISTRMVMPDGRLAHSWCDGRTHPGNLDDHAAMSRAALALYQATGEDTYITQAMRWVELLNHHYKDKERGGYFFSPQDASDLIVRVRNAFDGPTPSGNGLMVEVLATLYFLTGDAAYRHLVDQQIGAFAGEAVRNALPLSAFLSGMDFYLHGIQIVLCEGEGAQDLLSAIWDVCVPNRILTVKRADKDLPAGHPAAGKTAIDNQATAYICSGPVCSPPVAEPGLLSTILAAPDASAMQTQWSKR